MAMPSQELEVQKFLREFQNLEMGLKQLQLKYNIKVEEDYLCFSDGNEEPVFVFNYDPIRSRGDIKIENECRGLILDKHTDVVSCSFKRFFNIGEANAYDIDWETARLEEKLDGTMVVLYSHKDEFFIQTRSRAMADGTLLQDPTRSYWEAVLDILAWKFENPAIEFLKQDTPYKLENQCWIFEYVSPDNHHVTPYDDEKLVLIGATHKKLGGIPTSTGYLDRLAEYFGFDRPNLYKVSSAEEAKKYATQWCDALEEGFVVVDNMGHRIKVKNPTYLHVNRVLNGLDELSPRHFARIVLSGEAEEISSYFGGYEDILLLMATTLEEVMTEIDNIWAFHCKIPTKKQFANAIKGHRYSHILFETWDGRINNFEDAIVHITPDQLIKETKERHASSYRRAMQDAFKYRGKTQ